MRRDEAVDWYARRIAGDNGPLRETIVEALAEKLDELDAAGARPRWRTAGDANVCDVCAELEGAELLEGERPPHENCENPNGCRCTRELGKPVGEAIIEWQRARELAP